MSELNQVQQRIKAWADARMPNRDLPGRIRKLGEEHGEFGEAITRYIMDSTPANAVKAGIEAADIVLILADMMELMDVSLHSFILTKLIELEMKPVVGFREFKSDMEELIVEVGQLKQGLWPMKDKEIASWKDAYENMRDFAISKGLDITCYSK